MLTPSAVVDGQALGVLCAEIPVRCSMKLLKPTPLARSAPRRENRPCAQRLAISSK
jgi:hypothetical protein